MPHLLVRHQVHDFPTWKKAYDQHEPVRAAAGLRELHLLRGSDEANDVVLLFHVSDPAKAHAFITGPEIQEAMINAGVISIPEVVELE